MGGLKEAAPIFLNKMDDIKVTEFNSSIAKLMRIDKIRQELHKAMWFGDLNRMFYCLASIRSEVWEKLTLEEREQSETLKTIYDNLKVYNRQQNQRLKRKLYDNIYWELDTYNRQMADYENKYGMSIIDKPGAGTALQRGLAKS